MKDRQHHGQNKGDKRHQRVIRGRNSMKDRQHHGQNKSDK